MKAKVSHPARTVHLFGMRRSGLHPIAHHLVENIPLKVTFHNDFGHGHDFEHGHGPHLRQGREGKELEELVVQEYDAIPDKSNRVFLFEDKFYDFSVPDVTSVLIMRDVYDNMISRIKVNKRWSAITQNYIDTHSLLLKEALGRSSVLSSKTVIEYQRYVENSDYRESVLDKLDFGNGVPFNRNKISTEGGGPSFKGESRLLLVPCKILRLLKDNPEFVNLAELYYGYNVLQKLQQNNSTFRELGPTDQSVNLV